jgi:acid phosphatase
MLSTRIVAFSAFVLALAAPAAAAARVPRPAHVVVIVEENKSFEQIVADDDAPYINKLAAAGALFTHARGVTHPSLPNYLALFAGLTNTNGDGCPAEGISPTAPNLGSELLAKHLTFAGYSEGLPSPGWRGCSAGSYARKHAPWVAFDNVPAKLNLPLGALPPLARLPTVAFLIPNLDDDMHDGSIHAGDAWLARNLAPLVAWAQKHDTLIVLTWDEGYDRANTIPTILLGPMVKPGRYGQRITHYNVLRTLEDAYGLPATGAARTAVPLEGCWR